MPSARRHYAKLRPVGCPCYGYHCYWTYAYYGYYPWSCYEDYPYAYSYYNEPASGYDTSFVVQVQRRLGELGYHDGVIDGIIRPETRVAISDYESPHNLVVDGVISARLLAAEWA